MTDSVVVLHGIFRTYRSMGGLAKFLEKSGMRVLNLGYKSTRYPLDQLAEQIHPKIETFMQGQGGKLHFVGYSMGGLLIRTYLKKYAPASLGHVVMIGTPNAGSEVADFLQNWKLYRWLYGPAGQQLITKQDAFAHLFCEPSCPVGIISGDKPVDFISSYIIGKPNDGKVSLESVKLGNAETVVLRCSHTFFPAHKPMWHQALHFLQQGKFKTQ